MKTYRILFACAVALLGLQACEVDPVNPNYNPKTDEVVTNVVLNFDTNSSAQTKQSENATQATSMNNSNPAPFRGISDAHLMAVIKENNDNLVLTADRDAAKSFDLATVLAPATITASNSRRVLEMSLPLKTNTLIFYGKAPQGVADVTGATAKACYGYMDPLVVSKTKDETYCGYGVRLVDGSTEYQRFRAVEKLLGGLFSCLMYYTVSEAVNITAAEAPAPVTSGSTVTPYGFDVTVPAGLKWSDYANNDGKSPYNNTEELHPLEVRLANLYKQVTTIDTAGGELRAGFGEAYCQTGQDLMTVLNAIRCSAPTCEAEAVAKYFADKVFRQLNRILSGTLNDNGLPITGAVFRSPSELKETYTSIPSTARPTPGDSEWPSASELALITDAENLNTFPIAYNLPRGGCYMAFDSTKKMFYYPQNFNTNAMGTPIAGVGVYGPTSYYYPAELMYFGNSPIRTSENDRAVDDYPNGNGTGTDQWFNDGSWPAADWTKNFVTASTRSVAMNYSINYGVALLDTKVKYGTLSLKDNNHNIQKALNPSLGDEEEPDNTITISTDGDIQLTGVIIGQQNRFAGWDFLPIDEPGVGAAQSGFVYDSAVPVDSRSIPATAGTPSESNYTLMLDNFKAESISAAGIWTPDATQQTVSVALEFLNNTGKDFYGMHNVIRNGGYFYLIGNLDPTVSTNAITWPSTHRIPPYKADGSQDNTKRVFIQDFLTNVTFTIGENSLKYAYLTVPDLRSSSLTLGLSVDIKWETGCVFEDVILGGN